MSETQQNKLSARNSLLYHAEAEPFLGLEPEIKSAQQKSNEFASNPNHMAVLHEIALAEDEDATKAALARAAARVPGVLSMDIKMS